MQRPGVADGLPWERLCWCRAVLVVVLGADWEPSLRLRVMALLLVVAGQPSTSSTAPRPVGGVDADGGR